MPLSTLPNGLVVELPENTGEAAVLYSEIFEEGVYLKHGVEVRDGDCVFDIGANVGLFSVSLAQRYRDLRLVLFEPVPPTFAMLERNAARLLGEARVMLVNAGVSSAPGTARFEFNPMWPSNAAAENFLRETEASSRSARRQVGLLTWDRAAVDYAERGGMIPSSTARRLDAALSNRLLRPFTIAAIWAFYAVANLKVRRHRQRFDCALTTISATMRAHEIERVDLIKIDAEGAEWAILEGIEEQDWARIRQLAVEAHDVDNRVDRMKALLAQKGYDVVVEHNDWRLLDLQGIRMVYARRLQREWE
jgi:FkbM family methyltransferase